jgi:hypothetical protein
MTAWVGGGLPFAMTAAAMAYFVSLPSLATVFWTPAAFLVAAFIALVPALLTRAVERVAPLLFGATGILLLTLPGLRAAAHGPTWDAALAAGQVEVAIMDVLVVIGGLACIISAAVTLRRKQVVVSRGGPAMQSAK